MSRLPFLIFGSIVFTACAKKGPAIGDHKLVVPVGCKSDFNSGGGRINCDTPHGSLAWTPLAESSPDQALDKGERIIKDAMANTAIVKSNPPCTVAGQAVTCRRLDVKMKAGTLVALLGAGSIDGKPYYGECSYEGTQVDAVCNNLFSLK